MVNPTTDPAPAPSATDGHHGLVCPWWLGYFLISPVRRWIEDPERLLEPWVRPGMVILEPGCGMGYFTLPMARMVGPTGRVLCVDLQQKMLDRLTKRARRAGLLERLDLIRCKTDDLAVADWRGRVDLAVAIHMVHEVPDKARLLRQLFEVLRPGGTLMIREPAGHVSQAQFDATLATAREAGFASSAAERSGRSLTAGLRKPAINPDQGFT
jgi:ubiquinone/menaquinone biosynthesis C-methylase UbiE